MIATNAHPRPLIPPALDDSMRVRVTYDAGAVDLQEVQRGIEMLRGARLHVVHDPSACGPYGYLSAPDDVRLAEVMAGLRQPGIGAIWSARGGYGTMRYLDALPLDQLRDNPRWIVGYSDITALHLWANQQGVASLHAPLVSGLARHASPTSKELPLIANILRGKHLSKFEGLRPLHFGKTRGRLLGGNLTLLQSLIGTRYLPNLDGVILLVEEVGEAAYRIDRMLTSLLLSGRAKGILGIVFGEFVRCKGLDGPDGPSLLQRWSERFECPVVMNAPVGHGARNFPVILGIDYELDARAGTLTPIDPRTRSEDAASSREALGVSPAPALDVMVRAPQHLRQPMEIDGEIGAGWYPAIRVHGSALTNALTEALREGVASGIQLVASREGEVTHSLALGVTAVMDDAAIAPVTPDTRFDLASVTKAICTAPIAHRLIENGDLRYNHSFALADGVQASVEELLSHRSGVKEWEKFYLDYRKQSVFRPPSATWMREQLAATRQTYSDKRCAYSDIGYMLLGEILRPYSPEGLDGLFREIIAKPLKLKRTGFQGVNMDSLQSREEFAATEWCHHRQRTLQGIVHDENCQLLNGVAGHAGLFGTALEVDKIARSLLGYGPSILQAQSVEQMWSKPSGLSPSHYGRTAAAETDKGSYTRGWDTPSITPSNAGSMMTPDRTVGHLGYTGTSVWIDRDRKISITLLTNRVHPTRENRAISALRPMIHDLVMRELL